MNDRWLIEPGDIDSAVLREAAEKLNFIWRLAYAYRAPELLERRDVCVIQGTFKEVRGLAGVARLLDLYLREAPLAAARGRTTFREFLGEKAEILHDISALLEKIHRAAENVSLILPQVPTLNM